MSAPAAAGLRARSAIAALSLVVGLVLTACSTPPAGAPSAPRTAAAVPRPSAPDRDAAVRESFARAVADLEQRYGARLGVAVLDTGTGRRLEHRSAERFAFASTIKVFIAAAVLQRTSAADLEAVVRYSRSDLLAHAPITSQHVATGMTVRELLDAMLRSSDNTAANLLVERLGGPGAVQRFLRAIGDTTTDVDRTEPDLNTAVPGDRRDTTTPAAFGRDLEAVLLGDVLRTRERDRLKATMRAATTGGPYVRAGVPASWTVADKTGSGSFGTRNVIALVQPPDRAPIVIVLLSGRGSADAWSADGLLADATRAVVDALRVGAG